MGFTQIGKITKHKGLKGYCILRLNLDIEFDFKNINSLYLELRGSKVPFSVEKLSIINTTTIELKFKDYNSREDNNTDEKISDEDELYASALEIIRLEGKASTSFLQRKLQIGYNRAARIIDMMEENGEVSKANHVGKREVLK